MKRYALSFFIIAFFVAFAAVVSADHVFASDQEGFRTGYLEGYHHGAYDASSDLRFDYRSTFEQGASYDTFSDDHFRDGYRTGYADGYNGNASRYARNQDYDQDQDNQENGYQAGFNHGLADRDAGLDFNIRHDHHFSSGLRFDSDSNPEFRDSYARGYSDGYYHQGQNRYESRSTMPYEDHAGFVTAFRKEGYDGEFREFPTGRYRYLTGDWNDSIQSIQINGPVRVILFDDADFMGKRLVLEQSTRELNDFNFGSKAASMIVEPIR